MRVIQIGGVARSGKSTLAKAIADKTFEMGFIPVLLPFAKAIKDKAKKLGISKETDNLEYRNFCQKLGAEKRQEDPDYWVKEAKKTIEYYYEREHNNKKEDKKCWEYVIIQDDVRYMNEVAFGRDINAVQLFVDCADRLDDLDAEWRKHESEKIGNEVQARNPEYSDLFPTVIVNSGSMEDLKEFVNIFIDSWLMGIYDCDCIMCRGLRKKEKLKKSHVTDHLLAMLGMAPLTDKEKEMLDDES